MLSLNQYFLNHRQKACRHQAESQKYHLVGQDLRYVSNIYILIKTDHMPGYAFPPNINFDLIQPVVNTFGNISTCAEKLQQ